MTGRPRGILSGTQTKYCIACGARYKTKKYERKHCKACQQVAGMTRVPLEPFKAAWSPVSAHIRHNGQRDWNQSSVHCVETNKGCHACDNAQAYGIEWMDGCYMPHTVQVLLEKGVDIPKRYLSSEFLEKG